MLPKQRRIPRKMFSLLQSGSTFSNKIFFLKSVKSPFPQSRFCFSISKKIAKNAVTRNKLRRGGYHLLQGYLDKIRSSYLIHFSYKTMPKDNDELENNLKSILEKSHLFK